MKQAAVKLGILALLIALISGAVIKGGIQKLAQQKDDLQSFA